MMNIIPVVVLQLLVKIWIANADYPTVRVNQGLLRGKARESQNGKKYSAYLSIPYAEPPVGKLRFKAPVPAKSWTDVRDATVRHAVCPQLLILPNTVTSRGNEDCLYLNVFTPKVNLSETTTYPVMMFIHGGGYTFGTGQDFGPEILIDYDIIFVNINYRLGVFGFFSTGDKAAPGNNGLKDQSLALRWVYNNIKYFGGDPKSITIFGQSTGAACVHLHYFSPLSKGLFRSGISQSGSAFTWWAIGRRSTVIDRSKRLANSFNCNNQTNAALVQCIQQFDASEIVERTTIFPESRIPITVIFSPVIELYRHGAFLNDHPINIMKYGKYASVPWISGINSEDGAFGLSSLLQPEMVDQLNNNFTGVMSFLFGKRRINFEEVRKFYFGNGEIGNKTRYELSDLITDTYFALGQYMSIRLHLQHSTKPVYSYLYAYKHSQSGGKNPEKLKINDGTVHDDDLLLLFQLQTNFTYLDIRVSHFVTTMWTNYAKTQNSSPVFSPEYYDKWKPVKTENLEYLAIGSNLFSGNNLYAERIKFWKKLNVV